MPDFVLLVGDKNKSSWSVRAWLALRQTGVEFSEETIITDTLPGQFVLAQRSPSRKVPVLFHGKVAIWDSLAIVEYLAEIFPDAGLWPAERERRALARAACAEMHSGFDALRRFMPMDVRAGRREPEGGAESDIKRILSLWRQLRKEQGRGGPFLFGQWSAADAFFAPVASRFATYGVVLDKANQDYVEAVLHYPIVLEWISDVRARSCLAQQQ